MTFHLQCFAFFSIIGHSVISGCVLSVQLRVATARKRIKHCAKYTHTQVHEYTNTNTHKYTNTQVHKYKYTQIHKYTVQVRVAAVRKAHQALWANAVTRRNYILPSYIHFVLVFPPKNKASISPVSCCCFFVVFLDFAFTIEIPMSPFPPSPIL